MIGYREPFKKEILSLCEAISRHLVVERNGVRLLEAQVATGGIIDMKSPLRLSIEAASRKGLLESRLAKQLQVLIVYSEKNYIIKMNSLLSIHFRRDHQNHISIQILVKILITQH